MRRGRRDGGSWWLAVTAMVLWLFAIRSANFSRMGDLGLVSTLHWTYFAALGVVIVGFAFELVRTPLRQSRLLVFAVLLIVIMFGTGPAIEPVASITESWIHAGFIQYVVAHGHPLNNYDARFSWPGGFTLGAMLVSFTGQHTAVVFLRWFPLFIELTYLAPLIAIARASGAGRRAGWLGVVLFYATNWIYQDYFSPQALAYLFYLVIFATILTMWSPRPRDVAADLRRPFAAWWRTTRVATSSAGVEGGTPAAVVLDATRRPRPGHRNDEAGLALRYRARQFRETFTWSRIEGHDAVSTLSSRTVFALFALLGVICLALAMSHQITPYAVVALLFAGLLGRRMGLPELVVMMALLTVGWLSLGASNFWIGHLSTIFGSVGQISNSIGSNVTSRFVGNASHRLVVDLRILIIAGLYLVAGVGVLRRRADSRALELLAGVPILLIAVQGYGGEGLMRLVLFSLPFTSILAASAILPRRWGPVRNWLPVIRLGRHGRRLSCVAIVALVMVCAVVTTVVRGGNDAYESYSSGELAAMDYTYSLARSGNIIGLVSPFIPFGQLKVGSVSVQNASGSETPTLRQDRKNLMTLRPRYIVLGRAQEAWGEILAGYPKGWEAQMAQYFLAHGYRTAKTWSTATVLERVGA